MNEKIEEMFAARIRSVIRFMEPMIYPEKVPLSAEYGWSKDPVPFREKEKLSYRKILPGEIWGDKWENAWFHLTGTVPESFRGKELCLMIQTGSESMLFDEKGCPVYSFTSLCVYEAPYTRERYVIGKKEPGTRLEYWLEASATFLMGIRMPAADEEEPADPQGIYSGSVRFLDLRVFDRELWHLTLELDFLLDLAVSIGPGEYRGKRLFYILNKAADMLGYDPENAGAVRKYLKDEVFSKKAASTALRAVTVGHAHIDVGWLWPVRESIRKAARTFSSQLTLMDKYPEYVFGASQAELYQMVKENYPDLFEKIRARVREGRWEVQGGMWVEADCNLSSGESLVRQFLRGKNFFRDEFGVEVKNLWLPDVFGYAASLPQIMTKAGCPFFLTQKLSWSRINTFPHHTFRWKGIDGTEVLTHFPPENTYNGSGWANMRLKAEKRFAEGGFLPEFLCLMGIGDGGGGAREEFVERNRMMADLDGCPKAVSGRADEFFRRLEKYRDELACWEGELYLEKHQGTLTTQARTKRGNRRCEQALLSLEFLASLLPPSDYPSARLAEWWRLLLRNQFHDILPGSSIALVYERTAREHQEILSGTAEETARIGEKLFRHSPDSCLFVNTLSSPWSGLLSLPEEWGNCTAADLSGKTLPVQDGRIAVSMAGHSVLTVTKGAGQTEPVSVLEKPVLENDLIRYEFSGQGELFSAYDKVLKRELLASPGNRLSLYKDLPPEYDAWDIEIYYRRDRLGSWEGRFTEGRKGGAYSVLRFSYTFRRSRMTQQIFLRHGSRRLDFVTDAEWQEDQTFFRVEFPTVLRNARAVFDIPYGQLERAAHENTSWDQARFEVCGQRYGDLSEADCGMALLNDCKYGYQIRNGVLSLSLLRSPRHPDYRADRGGHHFTYSLLPHEGGLRHSPVPEEAAALNRSPLCFSGMAAVSLPVPCRLEGDGVSLEVIKKAEKEDDLILRLAETEGCRSSAILTLNRKEYRLSETDLMEWAKGEPLAGRDGCFNLTFTPYEIRTFRLERG